MAALAAPIINGESLNDQFLPLVTAAQWYLSQSIYRVFPREALMILWDYFLLMSTYGFVFLLFTPLHHAENTSSGKPNK